MDLTTHDIKVGDRVRMVIEAEVIEVRPTYFVTKENAFMLADRNNQVMEFEFVKPPVPPLPTTTGSVVQSTVNGNRYVLMNDGWAFVGTGYITSTSSMNDNNRNGYLKIIFDAKDV